MTAPPTGPLVHSVPGFPLHIQDHAGSIAPLELDHLPQEEMEKLFEDGHPTYSPSRASIKDHGRVQSMPGPGFSSSSQASLPPGENSAHHLAPSSSFLRLLPFRAPNLAGHGYIVAQRFNRAPAPPSTEQVHQLPSGAHESERSFSAHAPISMPSTHPGLLQIPAAGRGQPPQSLLISGQTVAAGSLSDPAERSNFAQAMHGGSRPNGPVINFKGATARCDEAKKKKVVELFRTFCENNKSNEHIEPIGQIDGESIMVIRFSDQRIHTARWVHSSSNLLLREQTRE